MHLVSLVLSLVNIDKCIDSNSEPEKCYPTKSTIHLAHLVKGELLLPEKKFGQLPEGLLPIRTNPPKPALSLAPHHALASLVKGEVLSPEKIRATTGGIAPYPHQPSQNRTIPCPAPISLPPLEKG